MQYVGVATSVGLPVQVPLILRSLADSLAFIPASDLPIKIDKDFLSWMGSIPYVHIPEHGMNWWASKAARKIAGHHLQDSTLELCLEIYRQTHENVRPRITLTPPPKPLPVARCVMCRELRVLYIQAAESLITLRNTAAANRDRLVAYGEMGRRRMAAAYELGELAQMKESLIPAPNMSTAAVASSVGLDIAASAVVVAPPAATSVVVDAPVYDGVTAAPAPSAEISAVPAPVVANSTIAPVPSAATENAVLPAPDQIVLNSQSQWISGPTLSPDEIIKRLGAASRRGRTWNMRSGQWHSGYFWALPDGKMDESGCSTAQHSVGPVNPSNFSQTSKAAEQEPPPTTYGVPDKFSSKHFRHTPPGTAQNAAAAPTPATRVVTGGMDLLNMFGPRTAGSSATVKPVAPPAMTPRASIAVPSLQPRSVMSTSAPGETAAGPATVPPLPPFAKSMFQMFGPPSAAQQESPAAVPGISDPTVPQAEITGQGHRAQPSSGPNIIPTSDSKLTAPAEWPTFDMFGPFTARAAIVFPPPTSKEQVIHGDQPMDAAPTPGIFHMFDSSAALTTTVSAAFPDDERSKQIPAAPLTAPFLNMFGSSAASPTMASVPVAEDAPSNQTAASPPAAEFLDMFGSSAAPPTMTSAPVAEDGAVHPDGRCSAGGRNSQHVWAVRCSAHHGVRVRS